MRAEPVTKRDIRRAALRIGFDAVGFARAGPVAPAAAVRYASWIAAGNHADMAWMERSRNTRLDPARLVPGARTILCLAVSYNRPAPVSSHFSRYVTRRDYHTVLSERTSLLLAWLQERWPAARARAFTDRAPVLEKYWGCVAGLGWIGKNTLLVTRRFGSWVFLAELVVDIPWEQDAPAADRCGSCRRCIDACPAGALSVEHGLDARRCVSYLTLEHKQPLTDGEMRLLGKALAGCDICQQVCPWNARARPTREPSFAAVPEFHQRNAASFSRITEDEFARLFGGIVVERMGREKLISIARRVGPARNPPAC